MTSRSVITGASGHAGANLARALVEAGERPRALVRSDRRAIEGLEVEAATGDVLDRPALDRAFEGAEVVYHLAARVSVHGDPDGMVRRTNVDGTAHVIDACHRAGVRRLVYMSSVAALAPASREITLDETAPLRTEGAAYDRSKAEAERLVLAAASGGLEAVVLSPTSVLGPHDYKRSRVGRVLVAMARRRLPALVPGGFDFVDARDLAAACVAASDRGRSGERYIIGGGFAELVELSEIVGSVTGRWTPKRTVPMWLARGFAGPATTAALKLGRDPLFTAEALDFVSAFPPQISHDKAATELGFRPRPLAETVRDTLRWAERSGLL